MRAVGPMIQGIVRFRLGTYVQDKSIMPMLLSPFIIVVELLPALEYLKESFVLIIFCHCIFLFCREH